MSRNVNRQSRPLSYNNVWRYDGESRVDTPDYINVHDSGEDIVQLEIGRADNLLERTVLAAEHPFIPVSPDLQAARDTLEDLIDYYRDSAVSDDYEIAVDLRDRMDARWMDNVDERLADLNYRLQEGPRCWVVFKGGQLGPYFAAPLVAIKAGGNPTNPDSVPILEGVNGRRGRLPVSALHQRVYRQVVLQVVEYEAARTTDHDDKPA